MIKILSGGLKMKMRGMWALAFTAMAVMYAGQMARADETSTTSVEAVQPSLTDKIELNLWSNTHGPSIGTPNSLIPVATGVAPKGSDSTSYQDIVYAENVITTGWKFTPEKSAEFNTDIFTYFGQGKNPELVNSYASIRDRKLFKTAGINHDVMLRMYVPTAVHQAYQVPGLITAPALVDNATYDVGNWTLGLWQRYRWYFTTSASSIQWTIDWAPNANWQFSKKVAATLWIDAIQLSQKKGSGVINQYMDIEPGINWDITPKIAVNPYLNLYPQSLTANATSINVLLTAHAF